MIQELANMQDAEIRKAFGARVKLLRKQHKWTQKDLADKLEIRFPQLNKYEGGVHVPPVDKLIRMAEIFDTTVDYLLTGNRSDERPLHNLRLMERFRALETFDVGDMEAVIKLIDALIVKHRVEGVLKPVDRKRAAS